MDIYNALFASSILIFAFACILWGLRIFKIFLMVLGFVVGFGIGIFIADFFGGATGPLYLWGIGGAIICAILAWPLQKMFVFTGVGLLVGFLVFAMVMSRGGEPQSGLIAGATMLVVAGFIAVLIYDYFVIVLMALVSAYLIINISYLPGEFRELFETFITGQGGVLKMVERFGGYYADLIWPSIVVLAMVVLFAVYMQKILPENRARLEPEKKIKRGLTWHTTFFLAAVIVVYAFLSKLSGLGGSLYTAAEWSAYKGGLAILSPGQAISSFCHCPILNVSPISFPLAAYVSAGFIRYYRRRFYLGATKGSRLLNGWIVGLLLGIVILPLTETVTIFALLKFENFGLAGQYWLGYLKSFVFAPVDVIAFKWLYSLVLFPLAFILIVPRPEPRQEDDKQPSAVNYCI